VVFGLEALMMPIQLQTATLPLEYSHNFVILKLHPHQQQPGEKDNQDRFADLSNAYYSNFAC
jgi:hypothetical protein